MHSKRVFPTKLGRWLISFVVMVTSWFVTNLASAEWNNPYQTAELESKTLFSSFSSPPKHLDPVRSYNSNEWSFLSQIYEPPLQYHYFKQPYQLEPLTLVSMPKVRYLNAQMQPINSENPASGSTSETQKHSEAIAYSRYVFTLKDDLRFQPHPAFVQKAQGDYLYYPLPETAEFNDIKSLYDFPQMASRKVSADDYIYAIKRMALRQNHSPILDSMAKYIVGLEDYSKQVTAELKAQLEDNKLTHKAWFFDLRDKPISGIKRLSDQSFSITIKGVYPQFLYWLTMNFFAPIPWEVVRFYKQPLLVEKNITLDTSPVGSGPFYLAENNPNQQMRLLRNPNFHAEFYPTEGLPKDAPQSLLKDAGKPLPLLDEVIFSLEKESVPLWNKFLQGYYDSSGVSSESFDQAVTISSSGNIGLTDEMAEKGIEFVNAILPTIYYFGFNMADPTVGGYDEKQQKLRQAISIAINFEEYISIFMNGRGMAAQSPIPPGIFGYQEGKEGMNPFVYDWVDGRKQRKSLEVAKKLLAEAGYPNGKKADGSPLQLFYDTAATGPDSQSLLNWYRKQFAQLGIELVIRATDYNRFQQKVRGAKVQMFSWGWNADYPDPENFLFLLYGGNATINTNGSGINSSNYDRKEFNALFKQIKTMSNTPERLQLIQKMLHLAQQDAPWAWGFSPKSLGLYHSWLQNLWPNAMANNTLKYRNIDVQDRIAKQEQWNQPIIWPLLLVLAILILSLYPLKRAYQSRQKRLIDVPVYQDDDQPKPTRGRY